MTKKITKRIPAEFIRGLRKDLAYFEDIPKRQQIKISDTVEEVLRSLNMVVVPMGAYGAATVNIEIAPQSVEAV